MTIQGWEQVKELHQAMQLAPEQRAQFLDKPCSSDIALPAEVSHFCWPANMSTPAPAIGTAARRFRSHRHGRCLGTGTDLHPAFPTCRKD